MKKHDDKSQDKAKKPFVKPELRKDDTWTLRSKTAWGPGWSHWRGCGLGGAERS